MHYHLLLTSLLLGSILLSGQSFAENTTTDSESSKSLSKETETQENKATKRNKPRKTTRWNVYSDIDLFAFSEVISIHDFVDDFDDKIVGGDTAFSNNKVEIGVEWKSWRIAYVDRFDYITQFTEDTALFRHAEKK